jgi:hypothetical protein
VSRHGNSTTVNPSSARGGSAQSSERAIAYSTVSTFMLSMSSISSAIERIT